jgi:uncharacterized protein
MTKMIFVNMPVRDLAQSMAFYETIGFVNEPRFTDETAAAMQWSDTIVLMILTHEKWKTFTDRPIPDTRSSEVMLCLNFDSREEVDAITRKAGEAGGVADDEPQLHRSRRPFLGSDVDGSGRRQCRTTRQRSSSLIIPRGASNEGEVQ